MFGIQRNSGQAFLVGVENLIYMKAILIANAIDCVKCFLSGLIRQFMLWVSNFRFSILSFWKVSFPVWLRCKESKCFDVKFLRNLENLKKEKAIPGKYGRLFLIHQHIENFGLLISMFT